MLIILNHFNIYFSSGPAVLIFFLCLEQGEHIYLHSSYFNVRLSDDYKT